MGTKPISTILTRDVYKNNQESADFANKSSELIDEIVNFSTVVFHNYVLSQKNNNLENASISLLFLNAIEIADGISVSIKNGVVLSGFLQLRSLFEAFLYVKYLTKEKKDYLQKSIMFLISHETSCISENKQFIGGNPQNELFLKAVSDNEVQIPYDQQKSEQSAKHNIGIHEKRLNEINKRWPKIYSAFQTEKSERKNWYSYFGGPSDIRKLAEHVKRELDYILVYRPISKLSHNQDVISQFGKRTSSKNKSGHILRDISDIHLLSSHTLQYQIFILGEFINFIFPEYLEEFKKWYQKEISEKYIELIKPTTTP